MLSSINNTNKYNFNSLTTIIEFSILLSYNSWLNCLTALRYTLKFNFVNKPRH